MNQFSPFVSYLFDQGVSGDAIILLLLFPVVVTIVVILRQIVGIRAFGIYTPSIITLAFVFIAREQWSDIKYAIAIYVIVLFIGMVMRYVLKRFRLLYLPRTAINLSIVSFSVLATLTLAGYFARTGFAAAPIFPILVIITLVEKFVAVQIEKGSRIAMTLAVETLLIALFGYTILSPTTDVGNYIVNFSLTHPFIIIFGIPLINLFLGKWTGLRLLEYYRFKDVIKKIQ